MKEADRQMVGLFADLQFLDVTVKLSGWWWREGQGVEWTVDCRRLFLKALFFLCASVSRRADVVER